jgi:predicted O-methyltransferase YrrM
VTAREIAAHALRAGACQKESELALLVAELLRDPPKTVVEIGSAGGGTFLAWCLAADPDAIIVSVDIHDGEEERERMRGYGRQGQAVRMIKGDSHAPDVLRRVRKATGGVDFLFIDGDHSYESVRADFEDYSPLVRPGGLIAFHDITIHTEAPAVEVSRLWAEIAPCFESMKFVDEADGPWAGIGVLRMDRAA